MCDTTPALLITNDEVSDAAGGVVALESTIITHGMPYPRSVETALKVEETVRSNGATPATLAVVDGKLRVGLTADEIDRLGQAESVTKVSRRDLPYVVAKKLTGGTTVAATMILAEMAGIDVFATGGIGGVHRGATETLDISADLQELARTAVTVVSAGFKSILDLGLTMEYLETLGVPVIGYGTDVLPAFYARTSDVSVQYRLDSAQEIAEFMDARDHLGVGGGIVVANPIPEEFALDPEMIGQEIERALKDASKAGIAGKETTPYLLQRIAELTGEKSLDANIELVLNNARLAAEIVTTEEDTNSDRSGLWVW